MFERIVFQQMKKMTWKRKTEKCMLNYRNVNWLGKSFARVCNSLLLSCKTYHRITDSWFRGIVTLVFVLSFSSRSQQATATEQEEDFIPNSPVLPSSLPATNKLKKHRNVDKNRRLRYIEFPLPRPNNTLFRGRSALGDPPVYTFDCPLSSSSCPWTCCFRDKWGACWCCKGSWERGSTCT